MDRRLHQACLTGDVHSLLNLTQEDTNILDHKLLPSSNTALHLASRFGHVELVVEILRLRPSIVKEVNDKFETPLHVACQEGNVEVVEKLMEVDFNLVYRLNSGNESALLSACFRGQLEVARRLLATPKLLSMEEEGTSTSLHAAVVGGHLDIVLEIMKVRPDFAHRRNSHGHMPIHLASSKGQLEIVREFLKVDSDLHLLKDGDGRTPLQLAVMKGKINIIHEILSTSLESSLVLTEQGESLFHLGVKNNQFHAVKYLVDTVDASEIINLQDSDGNTVLHLAITRKLTTMVRYLVSKSYLDVKIPNKNGFTAMDLIDNPVRVSNSAGLVVDSFLKIDGKIGEEESTEKPVHVSNSPLLRSLPPQESESDHKPDADDHHRRMLSSRQTNSSRHRRREVKRKEKQRELHMEGLRNARNTITIVAVLIATVTFAAAISPPGGVNQADYGIELKGKSVVGQSTSFKIFIISNEVALFSSLAIVVVLVSIIPFKRRPMMRLLMVTHKAMWVSVSFMAVAYVAAMWIIIPTTRGTQWVTGMVLAVAGGTVGVISVGLGVMALTHWMRKSELRRKKRIKKKSKVRRKSGSRSSSFIVVEEQLREIDSETMKGGSVSSNSDLESSEKSGFHAF